jgi:hypothetical protein
MTAKKLLGSLVMAPILIICLLTITTKAEAAGATCTPGANRDPLKCLACNCYYEARGEPESGQEAVTKVVMTRVQLSSYPDSVCDVVYDRAQFSWTGIWRHSKWIPKSRIPPVPKDHECYDIAKEHLEYDELWADSFYNPKLARPRWASRCHEVATIENHRFMNCTKEMARRNTGETTGRQETK